MNLMLEGWVSSVIMLRLGKSLQWKETSCPAAAAEDLKPEENQSPLSRLRPEITGLDVFLDAVF